MGKDKGLAVEHVKCPGVSETYPIVMQLKVLYDVTEVYSPNFSST